MSKTLTNILTVFKVARIVAKVIFILCIVGGAGCLLGVSSLALLGSMQLGALQLGDVQLVLFEMTDGMDLTSILVPCTLGALVCAGEAVCAFFVERYCKNVLQADTPFTYAGAKECFRLGLISIIVAFSVALLSGIVTALFAIFVVNLPETDISMTVSLSTGLFFLFLSMIFKHGAELREAATVETTVEQPQEQ